ncbi:hypothetical protein SDC9_210290 [bioreactor metagenome]|uniref:Uncharacterized protein n=1 Tax=bioreactor metagenome TaxID=1076179 RepID=A0A645JG07_9ZZZZ
MGVNQVIFRSLPDAFHKPFGDPDADIEICDFLRIQLAIDKFQNVGMVDPQDAHISPPPGTSLFDRLGGRVKDLHKADRP